MGIVHADIALGNIRLDRFGQYRLLDYGLARGPGVGLDDAHAMAGTPAYNSPEQLRGEPLDIRSDLYSLGLVFFHALTGRPAFATDDVDELAQAHLTGAWQLPEDLALDIALSALLRKLLATDRAARLSSAFELAGALAALGYELPSFLRSLPVPQPALPKLRRRRLEQAE
jgi:serine/threonine protein kinase